MKKRKDICLIKFENFLRKKIAREGFKKGYFLLHSGAIVYKRKPFLFIGKSGTRKSIILKFCDIRYSD